MFAYSLGLNEATPGKAVPQSPHFGLEPAFLTCCARKAPPGVLTTLILLERVLSVLC